MDHMTAGWNQARKRQPIPGSVMRCTGQAGSFSTPWRRCGSLTWTITEPPRHPAATQPMSGRRSLPKEDHHQTREQIGALFADSGQTMLAG
jgi:hypothetical protein